MAEAWDRPGLRLYRFTLLRHFRSSRRELLLARNLAEQTLAGRGGGRFEAGGENGQHEVAMDAAQLGGAFGAMREMVRDRRGLIAIHKPHGVEREVRGIGMPVRSDEKGLAAVRSHYDWKAFLSESSALRMRVLTVPSGSPVISAISLWVRPSKKAISRVFCCSRGNCCIAPRARFIITERSASSARLKEEARTTSSTESVGRRRRNRSMERLRATTASQPL